MVWPIRSHDGYFRFCITPTNNNTSSEPLKEGLWQVWWLQMSSSSLKTKCLRQSEVWQAMLEFSNHWKTTSLVWWPGMQSFWRGSWKCEKFTTYRWTDWCRTQFNQKISGELKKWFSLSVPIDTVNWIKVPAFCMVYRSLQVYQRSNTQVGHRVLSEFTLKIVRQMSDQIVRQMSNQIVRQMSDQILPGRSESLHSQIVKL